MKINYSIVNDGKIVNSEDYRLRDIIYDNENNCYYIYIETTQKLIPMCYN